MFQVICGGRKEVSAGVDTAMDHGSWTVMVGLGFTFAGLCAVDSVGMDEEGGVDLRGAYVVEQARGGDRWGRW